MGKEDATAAGALKKMLVEEKKAMDLSAKEHKALMNMFEFLTRESEPDSKLTRVFVDATARSCIHDFLVDFSDILIHLMHPDTFKFAAADREDYNGIVEMGCCPSRKPISEFDRARCTYIDYIIQNKVPRFGHEYDRLMKVIMKNV